MIHYYMLTSCRLKKEDGRITLSFKVKRPYSYKVVDDDDEKLVDVQEEAAKEVERKMESGKNAKLS